VGSVSFDRQGIADHAKGLASNIQGNLRRSLESIGVDILQGTGRFADGNKIKYRRALGRVDISLAHHLSLCAALTGFAHASTHLR